MANILNPFIPEMYQALEEVSRELTGFLPSVNRNASAARAAIGEPIRVPISVPHAVKDTVVSMAMNEPDDFRLDNETILITKSRSYEFGLTGEEYRGLQNGISVNNVITGQIKQGIRMLANEMNADVAAEAAVNASKAVGTAGTTPFTDKTTDDYAAVYKGLVDNGAPMTDLSLVVDTTAGMNIRTIPGLIKANEAGTTMTLRQGELGNVFGISTKESAGIVTFAASTATATLNAAVVGATELTVKTGSGSLKKGDFIKIAGDSNVYGVMEDVSISANAKIKLSRAGLRNAVEADAAVTVVGDSVRNVAFNQNAIQLVVRAPELPGGDDIAVDNYMLVDPRSGMPFEIRVYKGKRKMSMEVSAAWGVKAIQPEHIVALLG